MTDDTCLNCDQPVRDLPDPIPEGMEVAYTEAITGRACYCQRCWDDPAMWPTIGDTQ